MFLFSFSNIKMALNKLRVIVFDLDYTLWPFLVDADVSPPFKKGPDSIITDHCKTEIKCYPEVSGILKNLYKDGYILAVASRASQLNLANQLIEMFGWGKYFKHKEIYPGSKVTHFQSIKTNSQREYKEMMFFDDDHRNISEVTKLGVVSIIVRQGITKQVIEEGMQKFKTQYS